MDFVGHHDRSGAAFGSVVGTHTDTMNFRLGIRLPERDDPSDQRRNQIKNGVHDDPADTATGPLKHPCYTQVRYFLHDRLNLPWHLFDFYGTPSLLRPPVFIR